ncbi:probable serine/threonine-protein kinase nek3 [Tribolium castaneum]|uniref:Bifocal n=1 Tax=Tribolium castaneum TaxID=7070 RepID=D6WCQ9_TRICA|nr:PREDICTED: probable serine/threonine-protein kinase nek3 [Tribolium castaneum]EEZ99320.1 bifocal [Tribolium castaneum]|eukprot:XP_008190418.1 PREDICTED: probable serine/threonine-protein kinase nek3 [Tribolium castaneum]
MSSNDNVPQWKKELIARLRSQNKRTQQLVVDSSSSHQPTTSSVQQPDGVGRERCGGEVTTKNMVQQERYWDELMSQKSDSDEDLHYGPGIVSKLKERYLSLAQRENKKQRPTILRKATSLENILDDAVAVNSNNETAANRLFETRLNGSNDTNKNANNRYRSTKRGGCEMKRARSVETISSSSSSTIEKESKRESVHEEMLITINQEGNDKKLITTPPRVNRPKRIPPLMNEKEKPPVDVVKQAKMIFERRPEQRTRPPQQTGEVAAKVATYKNIIRAAKKPAIKVKPLVITNGVRVANKPKECEKTKQVIVSPLEKTLPISPIPDVSRIDPNEDATNKTSSLSETPDLIITSSPIPSVNSPSYRISATENFLKEEIRLASISDNRKTSVKNHHLPLQQNKNVSNTQTPPSQPLKLDINNVGETKPNLTIVEIEKNLINTAKTLEKSGGVIKNVEQVTISKVPKVKKPPREFENNSIVFKFTDRKDVPDYVQNDGVKRVAKLEKPKVGEGGIILLPGASIGESFTDEDEEILRSLEGPPSPCDVTFVNDNILIDGKSSLSQKTKKAKMKISFVEEGPEIYEYPSESSLLIDDVPTSPPSAQMRHSVPSLAGTSSLANYTPKSTEEFQPGVTRSVQIVSTKHENTDTEPTLQQIEKPILFSAGANSDILF